MTRIILRIALGIILVIGVSSCAVVKLNDAETTTVQHRAGEDVGRRLANQACRRVGQRGAVIISTANKNPDLPPGTGRQVTTFRCASG